MDYLFKKIISISQTETSGDTPPETPSPLNERGNLLISWLLIGLAFFLPFIFFSFSTIPFDFNKGISASITILVAFIIWLVFRLKAGFIVMPRSFIITAILILSAVTFIASLLSSAVSHSLFGLGAETQTFSFIFVGAVTLLLSATTLKGYSSIFSIYLALGASFLVLSLFHAIRLIFGADVLSFGIFNILSTSPIGSWTDFGLFAGFMSLVALLSLYILPHAKTTRFFSYLFLIIPLIVMVFVNSSVVWALAGAFWLLVFIYVRAFKLHRRDDGSTQTAYLPIGLFVFAILMVIFNSQVSTLLSNNANLSVFDVRPTWKTTISIVGSTLPDDPLWGVGPNLFMNQWLLHKPDGINASIFWNTNFNVGVGHIPSSLVTTGSLGGLAWLLVLGAVMVGGIKMITYGNYRDPVAHFLSVTSFVGAMYLWSAAVFYVPNYTLFFFAFLITGVFIASLVLSGVLSRRRIHFAENPKKSFIGALVLILCIIISVVGLYIGGRKLTAAVSYEHGATEARSGNLDEGIRLMRRAAVIDNQAFFYRSLADVELQKISQVMARANNPEEIDETRLEFQRLLGDAIINTQSAIDANHTDYRNWRSRARIYHAVVPLGIPGAYENALQTYDEAIARSPKNPLLLLDKAQLEIAHGDRQKAKEFIAEALSVKNNYTDALFMLSQLELDEGKIDEAISSVEIASLVNPNDPGVFFRLGFLRYSVDDYSGAVSAFERAILLQPQYANARYFLGLSYYQLGRIDHAVAQFKSILTTNPGNTEVPKIIKNLENNLNPFIGLGTQNPEERKSLPIQE